MGAEKHPFRLLIDGWALAGGVGGWETGVCGGRIRPQPTCPPGLGCEPRRLQEAQASSSVPYPLCCSEAQQLGREVIMKMENVVWPHDSASLTCLFAVSALHTLLLPPPVWRRLKKLSLQSGGEAKKSFPSPESQAGEERDIGIDLVSALVPPQ